MREYFSLLVQIINYPTMKTLPTKATLRFNRWEELHWNIVSFVNNNKSVYFNYNAEAGDYISSFSMNPWQYRIWIIEWKEVKPEHLFDFLTK